MAITTSVGETGGRLRRTMERRLKSNPYGTIAAALGVGFVLGGGLFTRLSGKLLGAGLRLAVMAALPAIEKQIGQVFTGSRPNNKKENRP